MSFSAKRVAFSAVFVALAVIANIFTVFIGTGAIGISFTYLPVVLAGVFFGPLSGFIIGASADLLGCIIHPQGPWIPLITLSSGLIGLFPGLLFRIKPGKLVKNVKVEAYLKIFISMVLIFVFCTAGANTLGLWMTYSAGKKTFWVYLVGRLPAQTLNVIINYVLINALYPILNKILSKYFKRT